MEACSVKCADNEEDAFCCKIKCHIDSLELYQGSTLNMKNFGESMKASLDNFVTEQALWSKIIDKSVVTCQLVGL